MQPLQLATLKPCSIHEGLYINLYETVLYRAWQNPDSVYDRLGALTPAIEAQAAAEAGLGQGEGLGFRSEGFFGLGVGGDDKEE